MKTVLPKSIKTIAEAKKLLLDLHNNEETFHPEDDANDCIDHLATKEECDLLNKLMGEIYELKGNEDYRKMIFDPCGYLLGLNNSEDVANFVSFEAIKISDFVSFKRNLVKSGIKLKDVFSKDYQSTLLDGSTMCVQFTAKIAGLDYSLLQCKY